MIDQLRYYEAKLRGENAFLPDRLLLLALDDARVACGEAPWRELCFEVQDALSMTALIAGSPILPLIEILVEGTPQTTDKVVPLDTETRTFLHDIPLVRQADLARLGTAAVVDKLRGRRGVIVEGLGLVAVGDLTVEQAYVNFCSLHHAVLIKVLLDLLREPLPSPGLLEGLEPLRRQLRVPLDTTVGDLEPCNPKDLAVVGRAMIQAGRKTVELGLVDSFFGNISVASNGSVCISQTGASLDRLNDCIDIVPNDDSSCAGLTASSELAAHRAIYAETDAHMILHGHPRFSVVMSLLCEETGCQTADCWKDCVRLRDLDGVPVVAGEVGAGGLARSLPPVIGKTGVALVYGHGVFAVGFESFAEPLSAMLTFENRCRSDYLMRLENRLKSEKPKP